MGPVMSALGCKCRPSWPNHDIIDSGKLSNQYWILPLFTTQAVTVVVVVLST